MIREAFWWTCDQVRDRVEGVRRWLALEPLPEPTRDPAAYACLECDGRIRRVDHAILVRSLPSGSPSSICVFLTCENDHQTVEIL